MDVSTPLVAVDELLNHPRAAMRLAVGRLEQAILDQRAAVANATGADRIKAEDTIDVLEERHRELTVPSYLQGKQWTLPEADRTIEELGYKLKGKWNALRRQIGEIAQRVIAPKELGALTQAARATVRHADAEVLVALSKALPTSTAVDNAAVEEMVRTALCCCKLDSELYELLQRRRDIAEMYIAEAAARNVHVEDLERTKHRRKYLFQYVSALPKCLQLRFNCAEEERWASSFVERLDDLIAQKTRSTSEPVAKPSQEDLIEGRMAKFRATVKSVAAWETLGDELKKEYPQHQRWIEVLVRQQIDALKDRL